MRVMISTPCSGGQLYLGYVLSLLQTLAGAKEDNLCEIAVHFQGKESLIHRARNRAADAFRLGGYDKLFSIDADISWTYEDFKRIVTSDKEIVGGLYPLKTFPVVMNFNPLKEKGRELRGEKRGFDLETFNKFKELYAEPESGYAEVYDTATGFLCVTQEVFGKLSETVDVYASFQADSGETRGYFDFYPSKVVNKTLESEDFGFCRLAREAGFKVWVDTNVTLRHTGYWDFQLGQTFSQIEESKTNK